MSYPTLVRGTLRTWDLYLCLLAGALSLSAAVYFYQEKKTGLAYVVVAVGTLVIIEAGRRFGSRAKQRMWCELEDDGFRVADARGDRSIADHQVESLAINDENVYSNGKFKGRRRRITMWVSGDRPANGRVEFDYTVPANSTTDPIAPLITRLNDRLLSSARSMLDAGQPVTGDGWSLQGDVLSIASGPKGPAVQCSLRELSAVQVIDRQVCLWRRDEEQPFAKLPVGGANACVLTQLVDERIAARPESDRTPAAGLGRILFQRGPFSKSATAFRLAAGSLFIVAVALMSIDIPRESKPVFVGMALLAGGLALAIALHLARNVFRCHERGVYKAGLTSKNSLQYADVATFTYSATRMYHNGAYTGTMTVLKFEPEQGVNLPTVKYSTNLKAEDDALDGLRDHVSQVIARRMHEQLAGEQAVPWTASISFLPNALEHRPQGIVGRKEPVAIPYDEVVGFNIQDGTFALWQRDRKKAAITEKVSVANFFPGFFLLSSMWQPTDE